MIELPDQIKIDINYINEVAKDLKMKIYVVGGFPRDLISGVGITNDTDLDVTEANGNAFDLAFFVSAKYNLHSPVIYESSGTALVVLNSHRPVEFHNAFYKMNHIIDQLYKLGVEPTPLNRDVYSRDFTINTLLFDPDEGGILDITNKGIHDIENKILRTPINPAKILKKSPKNILRGIRFTVQMGLTPDEEYEEQVKVFLPVLKEWLLKNPKSEMVKRTITKTISHDAQKAYEIYAKYGLLEYLPHTPEMSKYLKKEMFGTEVSPVSYKKAQTRMIDHLLEKREKHKAYMRRKKREQAEESKKKFDILEKARQGYYLNNPESQYLKKQKIDKKNKILNLLDRENNKQSSIMNWFRLAQSDPEIGLESETGSGLPGQQMRNTDQEINFDEEGAQEPIVNFLTEFANEFGILPDVAEQIYKYLTNSEFSKDTAQIAQDAASVSETLSNPMYALPVQNQTAIGELQNVQNIFEQNQNLINQMANFIDSQENTYKDVL